MFFIKSRSFLVDSLRSFIYRIIYRIIYIKYFCEYKDNFTSPFPISTLFISSLVCYSSFYFKNYPNKNVETEDPCLLLCFTGNSWPLFVYCDAAMDLNIAFIILNYILCILKFSVSFLKKECQILSKFFSASNEIRTHFLILSLFMWWITLIYLHILSYSCISGMKLIYHVLFSPFLCSLCMWLFYSEFLQLFLSDLLA